MGRIHQKSHAVKLTKAAERAVKKGHPWIYESGIKSIKSTVNNGDIAIIFDNSTNSFLAIGLIDIYSPIRIRLVSIHQKLDLKSDWVLGQLNKAFQKRIPLLETTNAYRLCFGESDMMPGLIIDIYDTVAVVKLYSSIWFPYLDEIVDALISLCQSKTVILRLSRILMKQKIDEDHKDGTILHGEWINEKIEIKEQGVRYLIDPVKGHKTGFFLDHRQNRIHIGNLAKDKTVLDVFSYIGGFSLHALKGGAKEVTSLDISKPALEIAQSMVEYNGFKGRHINECADAFEKLKSYKKEGRQFDIIIIDPPSMAKSKSEVEKALYKYKTLATLGAQLLEKNGILLLASCSSKVNKPQFLSSNDLGFKAAGIPMQMIKYAAHDIDHPEDFEEISYLKAAYYTIA